MARKVWNLTCMDRYFDFLAKVRKKARERANSDNIEDLKGFGPRGIRTDMWDTLIDIWMTQDWKKKSIADKNNRVAKPESMVHTRGSISFGQHLKKMVFVFSFCSNIYDFLIILIYCIHFMDIINASIIYINILIIKFDIHLDFDSIHSIELHIILQEAERNESISYGELYNKVHKRKDDQYVSKKAKNFVVSIHVR